MQSDSFRQLPHRERIAVRLELERKQLERSVSTTQEFYQYDVCLWCGNSEPFISVGENDGCSSECSQKIERHFHQYQRQLAFRNADRVEDVRRGRVYHRDKGICQLCGVAVPPPGSCSPNNPNAPQLDHVVPLMLGGDHTYDNIRLAHNACNNTAQRGYKLNRRRRRAAWATLKAA
jgi:5-methylcytosine-specific restriction endonuclease McrA